MQTPTDLDGVRRRVQQAIDGQIAGGCRRSPRSAPRSLRSSTPCRACSPAARGCAPGSSTGATGRPAAPTPTPLVRLAASMEFFQGAALLHDDVMDRSDTRRGMPSAHRPCSAPPGTGLGGRRRPVRRGCRDPRRRPLPHLVRRALRDLRAARRGARRGPAPLRPDAHPAHGRPVPRPARVGARLGRSRPRRADRLRPQVIRYKSAKYTIEHPLRSAPWSAAPRRRR